MKIKSLLVGSLLFLLSRTAPLHKLTDIFRDDNGIKVIMDPSKPFMIGDNEYYWSGFFQQSFELPVFCEIKYGSSEWQFGKVMFENSSEPLGFQFGCPAGMHCSGQGCYSTYEHEYRLFHVRLCLGALLLLSFICYACIRKPHNVILVQIDPTVQAAHPGKYTLGLRSQRNEGYENELYKELN